MDYGLQPTGFLPKPQAVIDAEVEAKLKAISELIVLESDDPFGEAVLIVNSKIGELWEVGAALAAGMDPAQAVDAALDAVSGYTGTLRRGASKSQVLATVNLEDGTNIAAGQARAWVTGAPNSIFTNAAAMVNASGEPANVVVLFEAEETGAVAAPSGTLVNILGTPPAGWNSITNGNDASLGAALEANTQLRLRRETELAAAGGCTEPGLKADLSQLDQVTSVEVLQNVKGVTDADGLPPYSFEAVVENGLEADIIKTIWEGKPLGIRSFGTSSAVHTDTEGVDHTIYYTRPAVVPVYLVLELFEVGPNYVGDTALKAAIVAAVQDAEDDAFLGVGDDAIASRLGCIAERSDVIDWDAAVALSLITTIAAGSRRVAISSRERAELYSESPNIHIVDST